jgi:hypothetical protein
LGPTGPQGVQGLQGVTTYTPATGAHWAPPPPTTFGSAIDRIAAAVYALKNGAIN